ncbi:bifunctional UDP-sugar hydrolase/5'-nucleotidase [Sporosarcina thermotolerans]|uniref:Bifunctional UDP-sugar hydrolase/5'-nucleotidase n=1 Tax=Sporosarcina thermotolerans TaxID=633404 RepID=A0AAW9A8Q8_9BACL|nr:bifunctional UDP-sugar hydrolase/5'-nucleotidase [Sporosarcina thermotolerans]MDW0117577.1 bifunctional UDP-sugar hydrolase/5'-nucleotidase [Sporosarcina thermotolerans]WHT49730.1 bifunctional UDP-sugar hydrolase/5'-nucleotidase [Sporosarcina thermotolerans]
MQNSLETIHIYHTNDVHSHFDSWPQISRFLRSAREKHEAENEAYYLFDIGDHVDRSHPFTEGTIGKGNIALLNHAGYDAVTIGNNEGITMSKKALTNLYEGADFDVILCNLKETDGSTPKWLEPYHIYETEKGIRIGVIGATAMYSEFYRRLGWQIDEPRQSVRKIVHQIQDETDVIICLSHLGVYEDRLLAEECEQIDIILGAHTHHLFMEGELVNETLLAATGKFAEYVGHITISLDESKCVIGKKAEVIHVNKMERRQEDIKDVNALINAGNEAMEEKVFYNAEPLKQQLLKASSLSSFFGRAMIEYTDADCAMFNAGIFLSSLEKGWVTKRKLHSMLPHPINPCVITLDGSEVLEIYNLAQNADWPKMEIKGLGFRGTLMGKMIFERLYKNNEGELFAGNRQVVSGETYKLATLDMFTFGFFFPSLQQAEKEYYMPELIRDLVSWYGKQKASDKLSMTDHQNES